MLKLVGLSIKLVELHLEMTLEMWRLLLINFYAIASKYIFYHGGMEGIEDTEFFYEYSLV